MATFNTQVALLDGSGKLHQFKSGDEVPEWATDRVGDHVLQGEKSADDEQQADAEEEAPQEDTETAPDETPDFTKPAPKKKK